MSDTATDAKTELIPPVAESTPMPAVLAERIMAKVTSGRLACMLVMTLTLCVLVVRDPAEYRVEFMMLLGGLLGSYATKGTNR